jgi:hypothetical protein
MKEIDYLILQDKKGGTARLTNQSPSSRYNVPVLEITAEDIDGDFGPASLIGDLEAPWTLFPAANVVYAWAQKPERTQEEVEAARLFLRQWPEGPQV